MLGVLHSWSGSSGIKKIVFSRDSSPGHPFCYLSLYRLPKELIKEFIENAGFQVLAAVNINNNILWEVTPYSLLHFIDVSKHLFLSICRVEA
jgi:hypothetical protein